MLANSLKLAEESRRSGSTIMLTPITFAEGYPEIPENPYGILKVSLKPTLFVKAAGVPRSLMN